MTSYIGQLHEMDTFVPLDDIKLTKKYRAEALAPLMLLTEKVMVELKVEHVPMGEKHVCA